MLLNPSVGIVSQGCWKTEVEQKQFTDSFFFTSVRPTMEEQNMRGNGELSSQHFFLQFYFSSDSLICRFTVESWRIRDAYCHC